MAARHDARHSTCPICYLHKKMVTLECDHQLCKLCWHKWSRKTQFYSDCCPTCPICRHPQPPPSTISPWMAYCLLFFVLWMSASTKPA